MADDFNKEPLGDISGATGRKKELADISFAATNAAAEINALAKEFENLSKKAGANTNIISKEEVGRLSSLNKALQTITVSTLKSSKARKAFADQILKAEQEQKGVLSKIALFEKEIKARKEEAAEFQAKADKLQKEARDNQLAAEEKIAKLTTDRTKIENESFERLAAVKANGTEEEIAAAEKVHAAQMAKARDLENEAKDIANEARELGILNQKRINDAQDLADAAKQEASTLEGQVNLLKEKATLQGKDIIAAKELQKVMEKIDKAGGSILESFQNLGNALLSNVPIIGTAFDKIFGQLGKASQMFRDATAQQTSKLGAMFKATQGFITSLTVVGIGGFMSALFDGMKTASEFGKIVRQGLGGGMIDASKSMAAASAAASRLTIPLAEAGAMVGELNDALGTSLGFNADQLTTFGTLTKKIGVSSDAAAHLFEQSVKLGIPYKDLTADIVGATEKLNAMNGTAIAPKAVLEEMGHASQTILRNMKENPDALIKAAAGARALGMSMDDIANAAESTLDFQSSMQKEMEAELMLGKELNLDRLRAAAASGDVNAQQAEMKRLVLENKDALKGNVLAQQMFADTIGLSKEELNKMMNEEEKQRKLGKQDVARQAANDRMKKMSQKEIGFQTMESMKSIASLADRIDKFIESFQQGVVDFGKAFMKAIEPLGSAVGDIFNADTMAERWEIIKARLWPAIKESFSNLGTLVMESLGEGFGGIADIFKDKDKSLLSNGGILGKLLGGLVVGGAGLSIAFKGLSALGGMFSKLRGSTKFLPMYVRNVGAGEGFLGSEGGSRIFKHLFGKKGNFVGNLTRTFSRGITKMFGRNMISRNLGNFASKINKIKMPNLTRIFSRLKMPNLTRIFSKIKLPNLTNVFSKIKIPTGAASGLLKTVGGKILAPLELAMGAFKGVNQVKDLTAEQKKEAGIREDMGTVEAGILGALTGNANKGSSLSKYVGIEEGGAGDEALGIATSGARGAAVGAAIGSVVPVVGTAVGAVVGGAVGVVAEGFKVFSDPNSKLRQGLSNFASATWDKAKEIGSKVKETAAMVGEKISDFATNVKDRAVEFGTAVKEKVSNFASAASEKISSFATSVGTGIMSFANTARDKAKAFAGAVGEKIGNIRGKISEFVEANGGLVGGIKAAAAGLASKASEWFGSKVQGLKDWWNGTTASTPEIKEAEIKKVTTPLVQMSTSQSKELMTALNAALTKGAEATVQAVNQFGDNIEPYITESRIVAEDQLQKMKELKMQSDKQHQNEITELRNQTALLYQYITNPQKSVIKMDSYKVGESLVSRY